MHFSIFAQNSFEENPLIERIEKEIMLDNLTQFSFDFKERFINLDKEHQTLILEYVSNYSHNPLLYSNMTKIQSFISSLFYYSNYLEIRQAATNFLLETYRMNREEYETNLVWNVNAKQDDFDKSAKTKIITYLNAVPFSNKELDILYKQEVLLLKQSYRMDTICIREFRKKSNLSLDELRDSIAIAIAKENINNLNPVSFIDARLYLLAAWLDIKKVIPLLELAYQKDKQELYPENKYTYKAALARLGKKKYESEILDKMMKESPIYYNIVAFICTDKSKDVFIKGLKNNRPTKGFVHGYGSTKTPNSTDTTINDNIEWIGAPLNLSLYKELIINRIIINLPIEYYQKSLYLINQNDIESLVEWLEQNRNKIQLNRDYLKYSLLLGQFCYFFKI